MWYYTVDGQQHGPFDETALDQLIANGTITTRTLVWKEGLAEWTPLEQARSLGKTGLPAEDAALSTCTMCGKSVGSDNLIDLLGRRVCGDCKPLAVQSLREGTKPTGNKTAWREGNKVVTYNENSLPPRCCKCNQDVAKAPLKRKLYWHPAVYYLLIFVHIVIYAIVAVCVRKRATVSVYLCDQHDRRRKWFVIGGSVGAVLGFVAFIAGCATSVTWLIVLGLVVFLLSIIGLVRGASLVRATRIKDDTVWLKGAGPEFLASLPPWT